MAMDKAEEVNDDTAMQKDPVSEPASQRGSGSEDESDQEQTDWLATTREKRSTAGNRLSSLLQQEEPDDELELLFAEADDDAAFEDEEAASDVQMDSSDDDDQGPTADADGLEGEQELQRQAKAENRKKRKANDGIPESFKKRVRIASTAMQAPQHRPKKKSERLSWLPTAEEAPTRASQRGTTKQSKEQLHAQMVDRELKRIKQLKKMEKAAAAKKAAERPPMTQADRMAEAVRVEKSNAKSLNRWEQAELQREEEQKAKLAALHDRKLDGPVITWWSGMAEWVEGNLRRVGKLLECDQPKEKSRKRKAAEMEAVSEATPAVTEDSIVVQHAPADTDVKSQANIPNPHIRLPTLETNGVANNLPKPILQPPAHLMSLSIPIPSPAPSPSVPLRPPPLPRATGVLQPPAHLAHLLPGQSPYSYVPLPASEGSTPLPGFKPPLPFTHPSVTAKDAQPHESPPPPPPRIEHAAQNYLILNDFDEVAIKNKDTQMKVLMNQTFPKATSKSNPSLFSCDHTLLISSSESKSTTLCAITSYPAKFRDPTTGLPYFNVFAYKEIQKLKKGEYQWSTLLGAYVGQGNFAAQGVPVRFRGARDDEAAGEG